MPAYNESKNIESTVKKALREGEKVAEELEVIVVNDGSIDNTEEVVKKMQKKEKRIKLINHERNMGMGAAVRTGIEHARGEWIFMTCADGQFDLCEIPKFLPPSSEIVIGYREKREYTIYRWINTKMYHLLLFIFFGLRVKDPSWVKLFRKDIFKKIHFCSNDFFWDAELLIKAEKEGMRISEVGVGHLPRVYGKSSGANPKWILRTFLSLIRIFIKFRLKGQI
jgi:glycosyltransferase involved in cell wall biosynthesis